MRGMRWLLLVAMAAILGGVAYQYRAQKKFSGTQAIPKPAVLPADLSATAQHWNFSETNHRPAASDRTSWRETCNRSRTLRGSI